MQIYSTVVKGPSILISVVHNDKIASSEPQKILRMDKSPQVIVQILLNYSSVIAFFHHPSFKTGRK